MRKHTFLSPPLRSAIASYGCTQKWLAGSARIKPHRLSKIVQGQISPTESERLALAKALDCKREEI